MDFYILYQKNQAEETNKAKNMFVRLKIITDGIARINYYAPISWIIGCLRYSISPIVALVRTGVDLYTRNISKDLTETLKILGEETINQKKLGCLVSALQENKYKSSSSNELIKKLSTAIEIKEIIDFLQAPINQGSQLQQDICHYTALFYKKDKYTPFERPTRMRRNSITARTG